MKILDLSFKNFNSYGNVEQTLDLNKSLFYLLYGSIGTGKSTIREVIGFALYGKVDGKTKASIVNRINKKELLVKIKIKIDSDIIEIERGIKPDIFIVHINNELIDTSGKENVQKMLETRYYKLPQATFNNIITVSIDNFKSFLTMTPANKKKILDEIFGLAIFNKIYEKINRKVLDFKKDINSLESKIEALKENKLDVINKLKVIEDKSKSENKEELKLITEAITKIDTNINTLNEKLSLYNEKKIKLVDKQNSANKKYNEFYYSIENIKKSLELYNNNKCPTCESDLTSSVHLDKKESLTKELQNLKSEKYRINDIKTKIIDALSNIDTNINKINSAIQKLKNNLAVQNQKIKSLSNSSDTKEIQSILDLTIDKIDIISNELNDIVKEHSIYANINNIFSDDGLKKKILDSILPTLNSNINEICKELNFPYQIDIDNKFNTCLYDLGKEINVNTLSTGEHKSSDIAVLLSILKIMKRNFTSLNLLFLDELLGNLDPSTSEELLLAIKKYTKDLDLNIIIINHVELSNNVFDYVLKINKLSGFSEMELEKV